MTQVSHNILYKAGVRDEQQTFFHILEADLNNVADVHREDPKFRRGRFDDLLT